MKKIVVDQDKCIGCGLCANACQQSAMEIVDGKAKVVREDFCDGLGNCLPVCPVEAISFEDVKVASKVVKPTGCPSTRTMSMGCPSTKAQTTSGGDTSMLQQWPVQIKLVTPTAPFFENADLLIAADCTAYAYANFHKEFMQNKITIIGCPKLDEGTYTEKLTQILSQNDIQSVTVVRMQVPCCGGLKVATELAVQESGTSAKLQVVIISVDGKIV
ncbi:MAG: (Fe-S)-binding protein [Epulopiscium sp. Nele67-Bin004]|nr:MAG: (Fe-S)-binding protein [Epulopiscium sp. Nele67-Bin004]